MHTLKPAQSFGDINHSQKSWTGPPVQGVGKDFTIYVSVSEICTFSIGPMTPNMARPPEPMLAEPMRARSLSLSLSLSLSPAAP